MQEIKLPPDYLIIGHVCHDLADGQFLPGGTATYAGLAATAMGKKTAILTSTGPDFLFQKLFRDKHIRLEIAEASCTTVFENKYAGGQRVQYLRKRAATLLPENLPATWRNAPIVQFAPIANEIDYSLLSLFPESLRFATIQGWLRTWEQSGKVHSRDMQWDILRELDIVIFSEEDITGCSNAISHIQNNTQTAIMTRGELGAVVYQNGEERLFPSFPTQAIDPTGAGDLFATAFIVKYAETGKLTNSVAFAHAAASLIIEDIGVRSFPTVEEVNERFIHYKKLFPDFDYTTL